MAAEDIEKKVKKISSQKPESGKDLQQLQEAQNQIVQINAERQGNLRTARLENNANAANNETMSQAVEMASLGGLGGAAVQQQVQAMNPQTQAVLGKYGLGQPRVQRSSSRNVQVTPQKITINNNTTNTTTNNVSVPVSGPVQGRAVSIKQDESQARFKTWISNAFAKQNQQAAIREKEYQRREWSLTRSTNKLMKHLSDLGKSVSERLNPQKLASSVGNQFRTILFLFGSTFLAKNWEKVIEYGAKIENFLFGARGEGINGDRGEPGFKKLIRETFSGENGLGSWLVQAFGGKENESVGESFKKLFWNGDSEKTGKDAGVFNILLKKIKDWFEEGVQAAQSIKMPKNLLSKEPLEALQSLIEYFSTIISSLFTGGKALTKSIDASIDKKGEETLRSNEIGGKHRKSNEREYHKILESEELNKLGITDQQIIESGVNKGDLAEGYQYSTHLFSNDLTKSNKLTGTVGSIIRQVNNLGVITRDEDKMNLSGFTMGMRNLDEYMKEDSKKGDKATGLVLESTSSWQKLGVNSSLVHELRRSGNVKNKEFVYVLDEKTPEEKREELKHATSDEKEAAKEYANQYIKNKVGVRKSVWKVIGGVGGLAGGLILAPATGGASLLISAASLASAGITGAWLGSKLAGGAHDIVMDEKLQAALKWAVTNDEIKLVKPYTIRLVPRDQVGERQILKNRNSLYKEVLDYEGWQKIKESHGMLSRDDSGNITEREYNLRDSYWRENSSNIYRNIAKRQGIDVEDIPTKTDIDDINWEAEDELNELREKHRIEQEKQWNESRLHSSIEHLSGVVNNMKNYKSEPSLTKDQGEFIRKMREAYSKRFKELGIDEKYIDALVAQDAIESGWGTSDLATKSNNFGGLKNGNRGWQKFNSLEDYINSKVDLLRNENGYYKNAFNGDDIDTMMGRVASVYDPKNNKYAGTWKDVYNSVSRYNPLSTEEIKSLRNQGKYAEADLASSSWEKIEDILRAGGVTDFIAGKTKREAGEAGNSGSKSYHTTENLALDIVPTDGNFERLKQQMLSSPLIQEYFKRRGLGVLDETTDEMLKKTKGTGPHFHIGPDRSSVDTWLAWNKEFNSNNSNEGVYYADNYVEEKKPESNYLSQLVLDEKSYNPEFFIPSFNSPFLASTSFTTPNSATKVPTVSTPMISTKTMSKEITSANNNSTTVSDILKTVNKLNDNIKLLQQGQLAQVQATTNIASGLGNMTITISSPNEKKTSTSGWTREPYT